MRTSDRHAIKAFKDRARRINVRKTQKTPDSGMRSSLKDDEFWTLLGVLSTNVAFRKCEEGIAVFPAEKPELGRVIKVSSNIQEKVWNWIRNPREIYDKQEWAKIRMPIIEFSLTAIDLTMKHGPPIHREMFKKMIEVLSDEIEKTRRT